MMCGACVSRVKSVLSADERVESAVVNMLTETAAVKLKPEALLEGEMLGRVAESLAKLSECGFEAKKRVTGSGVAENVKMWKDMIKKKELIVKSRNSVLFAWTLVALCCGSHASHNLHSLGIHVGNGNHTNTLTCMQCTHDNAMFVSEVLHSSYVKGGLALGAPGPGRDLLVDGLRAFKKGSPNMNSLVGFGSVVAFIISVISLLSPELEWDASFFEEPVMLLGFVLLGRSLEEKARIRASSDMNELLGRVLAGRSVVDESMLTGESLPVFKEEGLKVSAGTINWVEDAQGSEAPIQRLADSIAGPFVYSVMTISAVTFSFWYYTGSHFFPDVLLNDIAGPDGDPLLLSLKLSVDVLTGTLTEGKPAVSAVSSISYKESEILQMAAAVEKTALHPIARAIVNKAESLKLTIPVTRGQLTEPGFGTLAEVDGRLVAVGSLDWVQERFQRRTSMSDLKDLETEVMYQSSEGMSSSSYSKTVVYVGREGEGIIGAIAISNILRHDAESTVIRPWMITNKLCRLQQNGINTVLLSGDREEAAATIAKGVGIGDGINDAPSLALADVGIAIQNEAQENAASDVASIVLLGNRLSQVVDALDLSRATMAKVCQNLSWAIAYNVVAIPIAAGVLLPQYNFAMTPSLSGGLMALSSVFVVTNSLPLQLHRSETGRNR
ncbi:hypothetical protein POTOM_026143 [Populus tomentosa]|uniref:HMA domain-containing protein n=1 Tax=Populus tomentosa TaxID=118781 RepID=A0A8X7ZKA1_POPTO|nr:hypothetical protein POTOM_026143 [Populus tomentosa]